MSNSTRLIEFLSSKERGLNSLYGREALSPPTRGNTNRAFYDEATKLSTPRFDFPFFDSITTLSSPPITNIVDEN